MAPPDRIDRALTLLGRKPSSGRAAAETRSVIVIWREVMNDLERQGITTSAIRNRARRREYQSKHKMNELSNLFTCCGAEFVWEGFQQNDYEVQKELNKQAYEDKKKAKLEHEEQLRNNFGKMVRKKKEKQKVDEAFEVVE